MNTTESPADAPIMPQSVGTPLTAAAIFIVATINQDPESLVAVRTLCADMAGLLRAIGFRQPELRLSCIVGFGSDAWDRLFGTPRPKELHPFKEILAGARHAVATPGDVLLHIRAERMDMCFELATQIMERIGPAVTVVDEVHGFRSFDARDLLGFVDGTENPIGRLGEDATKVGLEDADFVGGSYVITQKYLHDLAGWNTLSTETQERIIGRKKQSDIELDDAAKAPFSHNVLTQIVENGQEIKIVRDNMPFGHAGTGEFGTYFIGYSRSPRTIEQMLTNMFVGAPPGNYDRLLDFSRAATGTLFFVPSATFLEQVSPIPSLAPPPPPPPLPRQPIHDGSLGIGSLKGDTRHE